MPPRLKKMSATMFVATATRGLTPNESITGVISEVPPVTTLIPAVKKNAATKQSKATLLMPPKTGVLGSTIPVSVSWHEKLISASGSDRL